MANRKNRVTMEQCRQKISKQYKDRIADLENKVRELRESNDSLKDKCNKLEDENRQLNEWVERMLEYTNMDKDTLEKAKKKLESSTELDESLQRAFQIVGGLFSLYK